MNMNVTSKITNRPNFKGTFLIKNEEADKFDENRSKILTKSIGWNFDVEDDGDVLILTTKSDLQKPIDSSVRREVNKNNRLFSTLRTSAENVFDLYNVFDFKLIKKLTKFDIKFDYSPIKLNKEKYKNEKAYQRDFNMLFNR